MKKIVICLMAMIFTLGNLSFSQNYYDGLSKKERRKVEKKLRDFQLEATIKTTKGDIQVFLYPEAAPITVANFVNLARNGYYDGLLFHRVVDGALIQGGDPKGDGTGGPGYAIDDEVVSWLNYKEAGMLGMANSGANTNGSQFFVTLAPLPSLNNAYTVFGEVKSREDTGVAKLVRQSDKIIDIEIRGRKLDEYMLMFSAEMSEWNENLEYTAE